MTIQNLTTQDILQSAITLAENELAGTDKADYRLRIDLAAYLVEHADEWASTDEDDERYIEVIERFWLTSF